MICTISKHISNTATEHSAGLQRFNSYRTETTGSISRQQELGDRERWSSERMSSERQGSKGRGSKGQSSKGEKSESARARNSVDDYGHTERLAWQG